MLKLPFKVYLPMPVVSAILLAAALAFAVVIGPQTRPWTWGPAIICLGGAVLASLPALWRRGKSPADFGTLAFGALTAGWFAWRAWTSPVAEAGQADLLLLASVVACFVAARAIAGNPAAERTLSWGIALLLLASVVVVGRQMIEPGFSPVFGNKAAENAVTGFFGHYNEAANYLIASSMLVGADALFSRHSVKVRVFLIFCAVAALGSIWQTHSRGGIMGASIASALFFTLTLIAGKRLNARWFAPILVAIPLIGICLVLFLLQGWMSAQEARQQGTGIQDLLDNDCRLYFLGIAWSCIKLHPMSGGGSQSFSWECFRFWDVENQGAGAAKPEYVHNELMQAATDYGLFGAGLLAALMAAFTITVFIKTIFRDAADDDTCGEAWRIGAAAAVAGMFIQSCFSFVFHLLPGAMLLGISLGMMSRSRAAAPGPQATGVKFLLSAAALAVAALLLPNGWTGTRVTHALWATHFGKNAETSAESQIDALSEALRLWPHTSFLQERATLFQTLAGMSDHPGFKDPAERALDDYEAAARLHPFEPGFAVNRANVLSQLERDAEAEQAYAQAIRLQGGMEAGFRSNYYSAIHYLKKSHRQFGPDLETALITLETATNCIEKAFEETPIWTLATEGREIRVAIHESLGTAREASGDHEGALESYNFAATLHGGHRAHYRAGVLTGKMAVEAWSKRQPSEAMKLFIEARRRVGQAGTNLPAGVTPSQSAEYTAYLDRTIEFLKGAKVNPSP